MATVDEGTTQAPAQSVGQQSRHDPDIISALAEKIMGMMEQPMPQAPTPPAFRGLSPGLAVAATLNPQNRDLFIQKQMGPENAAYAQQRAAFEAAMKQRQSQASGAIDIYGNLLSSRDRMAGVNQRTESDAASLRQRTDSDAARLAEDIRHNKAMEEGRGGSNFPKTAQTKTDENGRILQYDPSTGKWGQAMDSSGNPMKATPPASLIGIQQQLDNVGRLFNEMKSNYLAGPKSTVGRAFGTGTANLLGRGFGASAGLSGFVPDKHALIHERDREAAATALAFPLTLTRRSVEGARQSLLNVIPHYSDPPEVWAVFDKQMTDLINTARSIPWGTMTEENARAAAENFANRLDLAINTMQSTQSGGATTNPTNPLDDLANKHGL